MTSLVISRQEWVQQSATQLHDISDTPKLDARLLLCHILNLSQTALLTWPDEIIPNHKVAPLTDALRRRQSGEPVAYIIGQTEFWGLTLRVTDAVLIPRPETELLVETAVSKLTQTSNTTPNILELGTGSGAIAIALASEFPEATLTAVDLSESALEVAKGNASMYQMTNIAFVQSDWFTQINTLKAFDLIITNPPYIADHDPHLKNLAFEPVIALTSGTSGLTDIEQIVRQSSDYLKSDGWLMIEHGFDQGASCRQLFEENQFHSVATCLDLAKHERITIGQKRDP